MYFYISLSIKHFDQFFIRYIFGFLTAFSDLYIKYTLAESYLVVFTGSNKQFYESQLYLIPLSFALIQLAIEVYHFYKKEKRKWIRLKRMKNSRNE